MITKYEQKNLRYRLSKVDVSSHYTRTLIVYVPTRNNIFCANNSNKTKRTQRLSHSSFLDASGMLTITYYDFYPILIINKLRFSVRIYHGVDNQNPDNQIPDDQSTVLCNGYGGGLWHILSVSETLC